MKDMRTKDTPTQKVPVSEVCALRIRLCLSKRGHSKKRTIYR